MFDKAKMLAKAFRLKKAIEGEVTEIEENGIKVSVSGDQKIKNLTVNGVENRILLDVINKAMKKSQENAARKMKEMGGLDGLF
jgi:predicted HAD superfamily phosphohydrolase YqeG